jgi:hypothetical protein
MGADRGEVVTNYLAVSHAAADGADKQVLAEIRETYQDAIAPAIPRTAERIRGPRTMARSDKSILALGGAGENRSARQEPLDPYAGPGGPCLGFSTISGRRWSGGAGG